MGSFPRNLSFVLAILSFWASPALSCICAPKPSVRRSLSESNAVFIGRVIARHSAWIESASGLGSSDYSFTFEVERLYKGALSSEVTVLTGRGYGDCGYHFQVGEKYLVYAYGDKELKTNICTRTTNMSKAGADLAELGDPKTIFVHVKQLSLVKAIAIALIAFLLGVVIGNNCLPRRGRGKVE